MMLRLPPPGTVPGCVSAAATAAAGACSGSNRAVLRQQRRALSGTRALLRIAGQRLPPEHKRGSPDVVRQRLLVPTAAWQQKPIEVDDRTDWRPMSQEKTGVMVATLLEEDFGLPPAVAKPLCNRKYVLIQDKFGRVQPCSPGRRIADGDIVGVPKVLPEGLWLRLKGEVPARRKLSLAEVEMVRGWVLFKNEYCIVINKPPGVACESHRGTGLSVDDLLDGLCYTNKERPVIVSKLEREASGCLILARNPRGFAHLKRFLVVPRAPSFCFWCAIAHKPKVRQARIEMHLDMSTSVSGERVIVRKEKTATSQRAVMEFTTVVARKRGPAWVSFYPLTLRRHQFRIAASVALEAPVLGDALYGGDKAFPHQEMGEVWDGLRNQAPLHLHCRQVSLPFEDMHMRRIVVQAPMPRHMETTWQWMGWDPKYNDPYICN
eukprot:TRINITY_DN12587_c0_g1_i1.p1 TRINITY_DN12587_c0_g1~~TRINITY_DN12587_c0_g1_i1.p1  ORF type:complete len:434 (+),score=97.40 TRINITY_DN12587_c0_g1_i1:111-1412(+)